ncbi:NOL1/NOP2/sun family putative RNA methylase [Candidatus Woesearchaeota archaeon]|nr:NOL1/NOP2/sun family putative RNA methylase [Candidatus Woesearchaeota archaeon]
MIDTSQITFKEKFIERYSQLTNFEEFKAASLQFLRRSIRVNTLKIGVEEIKQRLAEKWKLTPIPWCDEGFYIDHVREERRDIGNLLEHTLGYFYVQEAVSMIPPLVLDPQPGDLVLDLCAAPGSKTTQMAAMMENQGIIVANDYQVDRLKPLVMNVQRCGALNVVTTFMSGQQFKDMEFDKILVDAPCSGTGTIRKSLKTLLIWNPNMVKRLAHTQKQLISTAFKMLKPGGTMVYSTCTLEPEEDEGVVSWLLEQYPESSVEPFDLNINRSKAIISFGGQQYHDSVKHCLRIWPQDNDNEGFFVAKIRKGTA